MTPPGPRVTPPGPRVTPPGAGGVRRGLAVTAAVTMGMLALIAALVTISVARSSAAQIRSTQTRPTQIRLAAVRSAPAASASAAASAGDGADVAARALLTSPLYVDPDMAWLFTAGTKLKIERALRASPVRVFLAAVPLNVEDDNDEYAGYFLDQLYRQMHRAGVYLAVSPSGFIYDAEYLVPRDITLPASVEAESDPELNPGPIAANTPGRILTVLHLIAASSADPQQAVSPVPLYTPGEFSNSGGSSGSGNPSAAGQIATAGIVSFLVAGPLLALAGFGLVAAGRRYVAGRRGWGDAGDPGLPVGRMPQAPSVGWLRRHAQGELATLGQLIAAGNDTNPGWQRACDGYDAGMLVLTPAAEQIDLAGAIVLARDGRLALAWKIAEPPRPCLVNPLHGRSVTILPAGGQAGRALGRMFGRTPEHGVPVCARCARAARRAGIPRMVDLGTLFGRLLQVQHEGKRMPYFAFPSIWWDVWSGSSGRSLPQAVRERLGVS